MKLRLVLFSSCTLLFSSLLSLSVNSQQEQEAQLRLPTAVPLLAAKAAKPEFGPNVLIFDPSMPAQAIQKEIDAVYATQQHNELDSRGMRCYFCRETILWTCRWAFTRR